MFKAATADVRGAFSREKGQSLGEVLVEKIGRPPEACWLFCSARRGMEDLLSGVVDTVGRVGLVGCTADGEISEAGFTVSSAVLGGIATDRIQFHTAHSSRLSRNSREAGRSLAQQLPPDIKYLQIFSDGLTGNGTAVLQGIADVLGPEIPVAGGTAGDDGRFQQTFQFHGTDVLTDAVVGIGFSGSFAVGTGVRSGWSPIGIAKTVTRASGNVVYELSGQPALEVYERFLGKHASKLPAVGVEYPLGLVEGHRNADDDDFHILRATMSVNREHGSITFAGEIPQGALVRLTCGDHASILQAAESAARLSLSDLGPSVPHMIFVYSCMARKIVLGRRTREETDLIRTILGGSLPIIGFYTYGEYCPVKRGRPTVFHNETITISLIGA